MGYTNLYKGGIGVAAGVKEKKDKSLEKIFACIDNKESFLLDAGAGSSKTWPLIKTVDYIIAQKGKKLNRLAKRIGCITYTNAAVDEIEERYGENEVLVVNTIHEFFWSIISDYQQELKEIMVELYDEIKNIDNLKNLRIQYKEFKRISEGIISHDEVIKLSGEIFANYPKLKKIFMDRFPFVLIDEYQDTHQEIVNIFLEFIAAESENKDFIVGFFGDFMQSIYENRTGRITAQDNLQHISKETNFRSAPEVIDLLNNIRTDIEQYPAGKNNKIEGSASFIYLDDEMQDSNDIFDKVEKE